MEQLNIGGKLIAPIIKNRNQYLVLLEKEDKGIKRKVLCEVLYVSLRGMYGADREQI
jgi:protein-L-isoaspartate O-methyltransferase